MEKDFQSAPKSFWQTIRRLRRGKRGSMQAVYSKGGTLLTSTEEVIGQWKEHFEELLNPTTPSTVETELEDEGQQTSISLDEVNVVVKHLRSGKAPGVWLVAGLSSWSRGQQQPPPSSPGHDLSAQPSISTLRFQLGSGSRCTM
ncbi:hypothetical protein NHX12_013263 [Muraenolepis orangiensis]|uniref:Uncharacterized protein n=1 Tax=Muraenolepis orangiensis TaxID=630683 RepID=A0A9Q0I7X3_9TELE|nr:hypothetical protein NHX12_013263 [Muraenolepis orangiensis]